METNALALDFDRIAIHDRCCPDDFGCHRWRCDKQRDGDKKVCRTGFHFQCRLKLSPAAEAVQRRIEASASQSRLEVQTTRPMMWTSSASRS
jgi:hypothetical protein